MAVHGAAASEFVKSKLDEFFWEWLSLPEAQKIVRQALSGTGEVSSKAEGPVPSPHFSTLRGSPSGRPSPPGSPARGLLREQASPDAPVGSEWSGSAGSQPSPASPGSRGQAAVANEVPASAPRKSLKEGGEKLSSTLSATAPALSGSKVIPRFWTPKLQVPPDSLPAAAREKIHTHFAKQAITDGIRTHQQLEPIVTEVFRLSKYFVVPIFHKIKIFDVDGGGLISVGVLERSLMKFDGSVFTEDTLGELLGAVPHGPGPYGEEAVSIKAFAVLVGSPEPPRRQRPRSAEARGVPLHARVGGALAFDLRGFREALALDTPSPPGAALGPCAADRGRSSDEVSEHELSLVKEDLKMRAKEYVLDVQRRSLLPLWEAVPCGRAGVLALADCQQLVAAYLRELAPRSAELVRATVELGIELSVLLFERRNKDPDARGRVRAQAKLQADALVDRVAPLVREMLETMQQEDPRMLAADLMECLGSDAHGTVTREAFETHFVEAMRYVLGPERMVERLQCLGAVPPGVRPAAAVQA